MQYRWALLLLLASFFSSPDSWAGPASDATWPRITILPPRQPPVIDGVLAPWEWEGAVTLTGFTRLRETALAAGQPTVYLAWTEAALYVGAEIALPAGQKATARTTDFDGTVWQDDSLEIHLDRGHRHQKNFQFIVNALGTKFDALGGDKAFNAVWEAKARNEPGCWTAELAIPWQAIGGAPQAGELDGFNVLVNASHLGGVLTWAPLQGSAHETAYYGHLLYGRQAALGVDGLSRSPKEIVLRSLGRQAIAVEYELARGGQALEQRSFTLEPSRASPIPVAIPQKEGLPEPGEYRLTLRARGPEGLLFMRSVTFTLQEALRLIFSANETAGLLRVRVQTEPSVFPPEETKLRLTVRGPQGIVKQSNRERLPAQPQEPVLILRRTETPPGRLEFVAEAVNARTGQRYRVERALESPLHPVWLGTKEGLTERVPAPWTPLSVQGNVVSCWGRQYTFGGGPLPMAISSRGASLLAGPIRLTGETDKGPLVWRKATLTIAEKKPATVRLKGVLEEAALRLSGMATIEYDGMIRCDLSLTPTRGMATIRALTLEIPLKPEHACYLYHFPGRWGSVANSGYLPKEGWQSPFKPFVWLGDEDRGLGWFCESDRNWWPLDNKQAITIERQPTATTLRLHLISGETKITAPLTYTFGFQATPVKQPEKTVWDYRLTHFGNYGLEKQPATLGGVIRYPAKGHLRREEGTFECFYRTAVDSENEVPLAQRKFPGNRDIFTVMVRPGGDGTNYGLYWNGTSQGLVAWARTNGVVTDNPHTTQRWRAGEWRHIAMTWDKEKLCLYLDGKKIVETPNRGFLAGITDEAEIRIGGEGALATIDEVRILSVARPPVVPDKPYAPDSETLLLDHFDDYAPAGQTVAAATDKAATKGPGIPDPWLRFGPGKFGLAPTWEPATEQTRLAQLAALGVRTICFHEHWVPYQSYPYVTEADRPRLKSLVEGLHAHGLNLLLYMSRQFADNCPEWELLNEEFCTEPRPGPYTRQPPQRAYIACWNSPYKDFCLYYLAKMLDEFGHDGWYLDGPEWPMPCANREHGCGYQAPDGTWRPTWDIFATRDFMKRLYVLTRQRRPQGQLNIHNSTVLVTPTLGFGTSTWGGEQLDAIPPPVKTLEILPLDAFRTEFMGRQWGLPAEFLVYDGRPYYARDMLAYTLLHGVLIRPSAPDALARIAALWRVHDEFPFSHGEMYGYWNNGEIIRIEGSPSGALTERLGEPNIYASVWTLPKRGALIVVSNLMDKEAEAKLAINFARLGLTPQARIWDALTGEPLPHTNGRLTFSVAAWRYRVLRLQ